MASLAHALLLQLARSLEPTRTQLKEASSSQNRIRALLESGAIGSCIENSVLIGSYARHTAVAPIDDIDILFQVDPSHWATWPFRPNPAAVIATFHRAVKYRYPDSQVRKQRRSVGLIMARRSIDIVPALATREPGIYRIPDRIEETWIYTAPQKHAEAITRINQQNGGLVVPLIKLAKVWNRCLPSTARLKSFAIETIVGTLFSKYSINNIAEGLRDVFDFMVFCGPFGGPKSICDWNDDLGVSIGRFTASAPVLSGLDGNALAGAESARCVKFIDKARANRDRIQDLIERPTDANVRRQMRLIFPTG